MNKIPTIIWSWQHPMEYSTTIIIVNRKLLSFVREAIIYLNFGILALTFRHSRFGPRTQPISFPPDFNCSVVLKKWFLRFNLKFVSVKFLIWVLVVKEILKMMELRDCIPFIIMAVQAFIFFSVESLEMKFALVAVFAFQIWQKSKSRKVEPEVEENSSPAPKRKLKKKKE